jgi:hypothetical protein
MSAVPTAHPAVVERAAARPAVGSVPRRLPGAGTLLAASFVLCALAVGLAWLAGEGAMAFWASISVVPLVSPVAYAYVLDLAIMHGVWVPFVVLTGSMILLLAGLGRAMSVLDEL